VLSLPPRSRYLLAAGGLVATLLLGFAFILSYVAALHKPTPHEVTIAVAGPARAVEQVQQSLGTRSEFRIRAEPTAARARQAVNDRDAYGALLLDRQGDQLIVADAAGPTATAVVQQATQRLSTASHRPLRVRHTHQLQAGDFRGLSSFYAIVGWAFAGYVAAIVLGFLAGPAPLTLKRAGLRLAGLAVYAVLAGLLGAVAVGPILGAIDGHFSDLLAIGAFTTAATAVASAALQALLSSGGTLLSLLAFVVVGNPSAGGVFPPPLMPTFFRWVGPWLPNGAGVESLRNLVYFDGAALLGPLAVLGAYVGVSAVVLAVVAVLRTQGPRFRVVLEVAGGATHTDS